MGSECSDTSVPRMDDSAWALDWEQAKIMQVHTGVHGACRAMDVNGLRLDQVVGWSVDFRMDVTECIGAHALAFIAMVQLCYQLVWLNIKDE